MLVLECVNDLQICPLSSSRLKEFGVDFSTRQNDPATVERLLFEATKILKGQTAKTLLAILILVRPSHCNVGLGDHPQHALGDNFAVGK